MGDLLKKSNQGDSTPTGLLLADARARDLGTRLLLTRDV
jgi:hypothetical protein